MRATIELMEHLKRIAQANEDEFQARFEVGRGCGNWRVEFFCDETADGHTFVYGVGADFTGAALDARSNLRSACKEWGYRYVA